MLPILMGSKCIEMILTSVGTKVAPFGIVPEYMVIKTILAPVANLAEGQYHCM